MIKNMCFGRALLLALAVSLVASAGVRAGETKKESKDTATATNPSVVEAPPPVQMALEPKAIDILKAACSRLAAARTMSFTAVVTHENPSRLGPPLAYTTRSEVTLKRPDKLRVITPADGPATEFYYDGKTMTAFAPAENLVAVTKAPPTIDAALQTAYTSAAIYFPFTDLIVANPFKDISDGLVIAFYIGQSKVVGGTTTDMIAYANDEVFVQAWIGTEDRLPRMVRAVYRADKAALRHQMELSNWRLNIAVPADAFESAKAGKAKPIAFAHPNEQLPSANRPASESGSSKAKGESR